MAPRSLPGLGLLAFWNYGENWKDGNDGNMRLLSAVTQLSVISRIAAVPGSPSNGDIYLLTSGGNADKLAVRDNTAWVYITPLEGWKVFVRDTSRTWVYEGAAWGLFGAEDVPVTSIGSGVTAATVQEALVKLAHHIDFLDTELRAVADETTYTVPAYVPPA